VNGSKFRTDLYLLNTSSGYRNVTLEARLWDSPGDFESVGVQLKPGEARVIEDVLTSLFHRTGLARLRYWIEWYDEPDGVRVTSRTYTLDPDGGTYGSLIPPFNNFQSAARGERLEILGAGGGPGFRTNLGLVDLTPHNNGEPPASIRVYLLGDGKFLETFTTTVETAGGIQINDIFRSRGHESPKAGLIMVEVLQSSGPVGAYATLTDNVTNDTTFLGAHLGVTP
jgi:hypothetical protein